MTQSASHADDDGGFIIPPTEMRAIIDKTADFVARNPPQFEDRIKENERGNPKFAFLDNTDPYHGYYQHKIKLIRSGSVEQKPEMVKETVPVAPPAKPPPKEPVPFEFTYQTPPISGLDWDTIRLTALFVARNGRSFMNQIAQKEAKNHLFDFLRPSHHLFHFFTLLVEHYTKVFLPPQAQTERLQSIVNDKFMVLERAHERLEWQIYQDELRQKKEKADEAERMAFALIDWQDFVVVQGVEFTEEDDKLALPAPTTIEELETVSLAQKKAKFLFEDVRQLEEIRMDIEKSPSPEPVNVVESNPILQNVKIKTDYVPKNKKDVKKPMSICPRCGQSIPSDELQEHMRVELLDPKWREQKAVADARKKETNLTTQDITKSLNKIGQHRADIFGGDDYETIKAREEAEKQRAKEKEKIVWDGHAVTVKTATKQALQSVTLDEAMAAMKRAQGTAEEFTKIGPSFGLPPRPNVPPPPHIPPPPHMQIPPLQVPFSNAPIPLASLNPDVLSGTAIPSKKRVEEAVEAPAPKKLKVDGMIEEAEFILRYPDPITIKIQTLTMDKVEWLKGESFEIGPVPPSTTIGDLRDDIQKKIGMPVGKQKLMLQHKDGNSEILKVSASCAYYNIRNGATLTLGLKERGGRK